jgi:cyanocobalamin reductase (cyanide-eliminating) / alkylcobalamin dealkylase
VSRAEWQEIVARLDSGCATAGLDLVHAFDVARYNSLAPETAQLPDFGGESALGILIGNSHKLWPHFVHAFEADAALAKSDNPLDDYVTVRLTKIAAQATKRATELVFAHVTEPRVFPIQRLAELVGFAAVSPSHLAIHPVHGPWLGLRAVVVVDVAGPDTAPPEAERPCRSCTAPCVQALERAVAASGTPLSSGAIAAHAAEWIAVRDACPVGQSSRYGEEQLSYHYAPARSRIRLG